MKKPFERMRRYALGLGIGLSIAMTSVAAFAADAITTDDVNMRAGPGTGFPRLRTVYEGSLVDIKGCLSNGYWCDVVVGRDRGWVTTSALALKRNNTRYYLRDYRSDRTFLGLPFIDFSFDDYWDNNYRSRDFYNDRSRWRRDYHDNGWHSSPRIYNSDNNGRHSEHWRDNDNRGRRDKDDHPALVIQPSPSVERHDDRNDIRIDVPLIDNRKGAPNSGITYTPDGKIDNHKPGWTRE